MIGLIICIAVVGVIVWAIITIFPMDAKFQRIIYVVAVVCVGIYVLQAFGFLDSLHDVPVPQIGRQR